MVTIDLVVFRKKLTEGARKTHDAQMHGDGRRPIGIGHILGSGALRNE